MSAAIHLTGLPEYSSSLARPPIYQVCEQLMHASQNQQWHEVKQLFEQAKSLHASDRPQACVLALEHIVQHPHQLELIQDMISWLGNSINCWNGSHVLQNILASRRIEYLPVLPDISVPPALQCDFCAKAINNNQPEAINFLVGRYPETWLKVYAVAYAAHFGREAVTESLMPAVKGSSPLDRGQALNLAVILKGKTFQEPAPKMLRVIRKLGPIDPRLLHEVQTIVLNKHSETLWAQMLDTFESALPPEARTPQIRQVDFTRSYSASDPSGKIVYTGNRRQEGV